MKLTKNGIVVDIANENVIAGYIDSGYVPFVDEEPKPEKKKTTGKKVVKE